MKDILMQDIIQFLLDGKYRIQYFGDKLLTIHDYSDISKVKNNSISWIKNKKYLTDEVIQSLRLHPSAVIVCSEKNETIVNCLITESPKEVYFSILKKFFLRQFTAHISDRAVIESTNIGNNVSIGAGCYICKDVSIGDDVTIHANVVIDCPCVIGKGTEIFAGTVIGTDGFGYYHHNGIPERVPHFGGVIIGDNVDIGANSCIDRGCLGDTQIGNHVKIDNLCHIAHNVQIADNTLITAGSVLCGSCKIGKDVYFAPGATILNQITVQDSAYIGINSTVLRNVKKGQKVFGTPAVPLE